MVLKENIPRKTSSFCSATLVAGTMVAPRDAGGASRRAGIPRAGICAVRAGAACCCGARGGGRRSRGAFVLLGQGPFPHHPPVRGQAMRQPEKRPPIQEP